MNTDTGFYRELEVGETIQKGDQYRDAEWGNTLNVGGSCGEKGEYRRPVTPTLAADPTARIIPAPEQPGDQHVHPHDPNIRFGVNPNPAPDMVNEPPHYRNHSSGIECIQITEGFNFCLGNAIKYIWRAGLKGEEIEDLKKARWYLDREIERLKKP